MIRKEKFSASDSNETIKNKISLALALSKLKKFKEAQDILEDVHISSEKNSGSDDVQTLTILNYLGVILKQQKEILDAEKMIKKALLGMNNTKNNKSLIYAETCYNYAILLVQLGNRKRALEYFKTAHNLMVIVQGV